MPSLPLPSCRTLAAKLNFAGQTFDDGGSDAPATSGDKSAFVLQCLIYSLRQWEVGWFVEFVDSWS